MERRTHAAPRSKGAFEVTAGEEGSLLLFSKLQSSRQPDVEELVNAIRERLEGAGTMGLGSTGDGGGCTL